jgi:hypothetical protein
MNMFVIDTSRMVKVAQKPLQRGSRYCKVTLNHVIIKHKGADKTELGWTILSLKETKLSSYYKPIHFKQQD